MNKELVFNKIYQEIWVYQTNNQCENLINQINICESIHVHLHVELQFKKST